MESRRQSPLGSAFIALAISLVAFVFLGSAELSPPSSEGVRVDPTTGVLSGPSTNFFKANITNLSTYVLAKTNATVSGVFVVPPGSAIAIQNGGAFSAAPGSALFVDTLTITKSGFDEGSLLAAAQKGYVDYKTPQFAANLAALKTNQITLRSKMSAYVQSNTAGDGAAGLWIWDPESTATVNGVCVKTDNLPPGDPGRWLKL